VAQLILTPLLAALSLGAALFLFRYLKANGTQIPPRRALWVLLAGTVLGVACTWIERKLLEVTGLSLVVTPQRAQGALLAMFLFVIPLEEGAKAAGIWPLYTQRKIEDRYQGLLFGVLVAAGFAASRAVSTALFEPFSWVLSARLVLAGVAHLFASGLWGYVLGRARGRWFISAWLIAVGVRALHDHIVFGRGPGMLVLAVPMAAAMLALGWAAIRDIETNPGRTSMLGLAQPPPLKALRRALRRTEKPLMLRWIAIASLVTAGAIFACLALGVFIGHKVGIDFSLADEADARSNGPLLLLAVSVMAAFPISGYLVARASGATTVLESALGASVTIGVAVALFTAAAPVAVLFALATAPIAFLMTCLGAWVGLAR
jgi:RsiW-degrading membrane proteinase PrsW (M82 family)